MKKFITNPNVALMLVSINTVAASVCALVLAKRLVRLEKRVSTL